MISSQPSSGFHRIVSFPQALSFSPSAVRNSRADSHYPPPLRLGEPGGGQVIPFAQQGLPAPHHRHDPRLQLPLHPGQPGLERLQPERLGIPLGGGGIPAHSAGLRAAGTASRAWIRPMRVRRLDLWPRRFCAASRQASSLVRVIAPAHREDDAAVRALFRAAREAARPVASSRPRRSARPGPGPPATPGAGRQLAGPPRPGRRPAAGSGPARRQGEPPRTGQRSGGGRQSPVRPRATRRSAHIFGNNHLARILSRAYFRIGDTPDQAKSSCQDPWTDSHGFPRSGGDGGPDLGFRTWRRRVLGRGSGGGFEVGVMGG